MSERMRFSSRYPSDPRLAVGARHVFPPDRLFEEWSMGALPRPDRIASRDPRPGDIIKIIEPRPQDGRDWWTVWAEDPAPHITTAEVVLTVIGSRVLATSGRVKALLQHLASQEIRTPAEGAEIAAACTPWLQRTFPGLADAEERMPDYENPEHYWPWVDGVCAALRHWPDHEVSVPAPPFTFTRHPRLDSLSLSGNLNVRPDTINRLYGGHRAN